MAINAFLLIDVDPIIFDVDQFWRMIIRIR